MGNKRRNNTKEEASNSESDDTSESSNESESDSDDETDNESENEIKIKTENKQQSIDPNETFIDALERQKKQIFAKSREFDKSLSEKYEALRKQENEIRNKHAMQVQQQIAMIDNEMKAFHARQEAEMDRQLQLAIQPFPLSYSQMKDIDIKSVKSECVSVSPSRSMVRSKKKKKKTKERK